MRRRAQRQQNSCQRYHSYHTALAVAVAAALHAASTNRSQAAAFVWPSLCSAGAGASGGFGLPKAAASTGLHASLGSIGGNAPRRDARKSLSRTRRGRSREKVGLCFMGGLKWGQPCKDSDWRKSRRFSCAEAESNGTSDVSTPLREAGNAKEASDASLRQGSKQAEFTISALLSAITPDLSFIPGTNDISQDSKNAGEGRLRVEREAEALSSNTSTAINADAEQQEGIQSRAIGDEDILVKEADSKEEVGGNDTARDTYKIRSLLLQGQITGLRERLNEREADVRELKMLTGGRGQSRLRELSAMLMEARAECDTLQEREKALVEELALSQKEGNTLRGELLTNQKALADLNAYADTLKSRRYTAEMVKLEASLAEMERELTRAEAAHMRERRALLDREASALADGQRFRDRTVLLEGEIVKTRARDSDLRRENARLLETYTTSGDNRRFKRDDQADGAEAEGKAAKETALRQDNAELKLELKNLQRTGAASDFSSSEPAFAEELDPRKSFGANATYVSVSSRKKSWAKCRGEIVTAVDGPFPTPSSARRASEAVSADALGTAVETVVGSVAGTAPTPDEGEVIDAVVTANVNSAGRSTTAPTGFASTEKADRAFREVGVARVVEGLRAENALVRKKLRAAESAAKAGDTRACEEATRADRLEAELGQVRRAVRERVSALKAALVEAEQDAQRATMEKEEFVVQWEEDVSALRQHVLTERKKRENESEELEGVILDLEDELDDLKARYRHVTSKSGRKISMKQKTLPEGNTRDGNKSDTPAAKERSSERSEELYSDDQWNKAMSMLQHLD